MNEDYIYRRIDKLEYLLEEIRELRLHYRDLKDENDLLLKDFKAIKPAKEINRIKLYLDYFK